MANHIHIHIGKKTTDASYVSEIREMASIMARLERAARADDLGQAADLAEELSHDAKNLYLTLVSAKRASARRL